MDQVQTWAYEDRGNGHHGFRSQDEEGEFFCVECGGDLPASLAAQWERDHAAAQQEATERERADRAEQENAEQYLDMHDRLGRLAIENDHRNAVATQYFKSWQEALTELATERAAAEALAVALERLLVGTTEGRVHTLGCECRDPQCELRRVALAAYRATHPVTEATEEPLSHELHEFWDHRSEKLP